MHSLFLVYFISLYMFRLYLCPSSGGTTVCIQILVLIVLLDECLFCWLDWNQFQSNQNNRQSSKRIISTNCCIHTVITPDDGPRYVQNTYRLTEYTKLCIKLVFLYTIISRRRSTIHKIQVIQSWNMQIYLYAYKCSSKRCYINFTEDIPLCGNCNYT